jgi:probable HAF family extracellular repeat protein
MILDQSEIGKKDHSGMGALAVAVVFMVLLSSSLSAQDYEITELGTLGGIWSGPSQIDYEGRVVGGSTIQSGAWHAFRWENGEMVDLGVPDDYLVSSATAFNSDGRIVGYANGQYQSQYAYMWEGNVWTYLGTLPGEGLDYSVAADINEASQVCGYSFTLGPGSRMRGWKWEEGEMIDLGTLGGDESSANAINELGQMVGYSQVYDPDDNITHAFVWENGIMTDLGVLPGEVNSAANDINEIGQIVGSSSHQMETYPFLTIHRPCLWDGGETTDLGLPGGYVRGTATGINNDGTIVGWMATSLSGGTYHAFVWKDGEWANLNSLIPPESEWELQSAGDINDNGLIVGSGLAPGGSIQGFLLTPISTDIDDEIADALPTDFIKVHNYPNPFNASTTIEFDLPRSSFIALDVYNVTGQKTATLLESELQAGSHRIIWNARNQASGVYYYRIRAGDVSRTGRMVLLK